MTIVLDASVAIKLYVPEDGSDAARAWFGQIDELCAPDIFLVEVAQALLRHKRDRRMSSEDLQAAIADLCRLVSVPLPSAVVVARGLDLAQQLDHRLHDCMYLALAERLGCPFLTADERLVRKVRNGRTPLPIQSINDPLP